MTVPSSISDLGFRSTKAFQLAWNLGTRLAPDGIAGPKTLAAAAVSAKCHKAGLGDRPKRQKGDDEGTHRRFQARSHC